MKYESGLTLSDYQQLKVALETDVRNSLFPTVSKEELAAYEKQKGVVLPQSFREFLTLISNGALLFEGSEELFGTKDDDNAQGEIPLQESIDTARETRFAQLPSDLIPFHDGGIAMHAFDTKRMTAKDEFAIVRIEFNNPKVQIDDPRKSFFDWFNSYILAEYTRL
ncbi:SMI1/KNR4 family protein [Candidatus Roizmanbacteria bacterium]|nr:SMI1/KNR4 family protein [Candidatus Roizmanbacteria bacterium]